MAKFGTKFALFEYFWARIFKKLFSYLKLAPSNLSICKISQKNNNVLICDEKCLIWVFLGYTFKKILSYLKLALPNLSNCKILQKNPKKHERLNLGPKMPYFIFGYFGARILKNLLSYLTWDQHPRFV